ncbi:MAG: large conductance mechanosensitive channel protein MscL [Micromonosporaceae bacterium]
MLKGFRDFIMRGNVVDMAVGIVIGVAFGTLVSDFTKAFIDPLIKLVAGGGVDAGKWVIKEGVVVDYSLFINSVITFVVTAAVIYFLVVVPMNKFRDRFMKSEEAAAATEIDVLTEIRDELRVRR